MFCKKCGKEILDEAIICPGCGSPTIEVTASSSAAYVPKSTGSIGVFAIIHAVVLVIALLIGALFIYSNVDYQKKVSKSLDGLYIGQTYQASSKSVNVSTMFFDNGKCSINNVYDKEDSYNYNYDYKLSFSGKKVWVEVKGVRYLVTVNEDNEIVSFMNTGNKTEYIKVFD